MTEPRAAVQERPPEIDRYLKRAAELEASDLYLSVDALPAVKVSGRLEPLGEVALDDEDLRRLASAFLTGRRLEQFKRTPEYDLSHEVAGHGRFRINIFLQRGHLAIVARRIAEGVPGLDELGMPPVLKKMALLRQGLLCVTGATGTGKSTTLAAMIDYRNENRGGHILTIEDPIEFVHEHKASIVSQREVGSDTQSYREALRSALRQAPDLLLVGEVRDAETAEAALHFAETGHLVFATLHSTNAVQTFDRLVHLFPPTQAKQTFLLLALNLAGIVSQRLIPRRDGKGRVAALEVLNPTARIRDLIREGDIDGVSEAMREARSHDGIQTFDDALFELAARRQISEEQALNYADMPNDLKLRFRVERGYADEELKRIRMVRD